MIYDQRDPNISNIAGHCSQSGEPQIRIPNCGGLIPPLGFNLLTVAIIVITGIYSLATSSCSQRTSTTSTPATAPEPTPTSRKGVTMANYNKLQTGMSYSEVVEILGSPGKKISDETTAPDTATYMWGGDQVGNIRVTFQNDRLLQKSEYSMQ